MILCINTCKWELIRTRYDSLSPLIPHLRHYIVLVRRLCAILAATATKFVKHLEWSFVENRMRRTGFKEMGISRIMVLINEAVLDYSFEVRE